MGYEIYKFQNTGGIDTQPTIEISVGDDDWNQAHSNWQQMKNLTDSIEWKKGVFALTRGI